MQTLACPARSHLGVTQTRWQCPLCHCHVPSSQSSPPPPTHQHRRTDTPRASRSGLLSLILWSYEIWGSFFISPPTPRFSFGAISPPVFPNTFGKIQALPWHILQTLPSLALAAPLRASTSSSLTTWLLTVGFFHGFHFFCYFTSIFLSCSMISSPNTHFSLGPSGSSICTAGSPLPAHSLLDSRFSSHQAKHHVCGHVSLPFAAFPPWFSPTCPILVPPHPAPRPAPPL